MKPNIIVPHQEWNLVFNGTRAGFGHAAPNTGLNEKITFSSVILISHFEATRGLFWDGPRNFELWSDDEDDTRADTSPPNCRTKPAGALLTQVRFNEYHVHKNGGSAELGFEPGVL
ncbi:hypothetical protein AVEN_106409-1 [Araneus ventricosus]|uniref:Uncharacterized protein n=1 Tax=Araneus ventricosus TaxID=182803 RepID=A0A4Y2AUN8_ARAVE|nr:hypothetical protein AVEN_106409-1 [Araneus ventricosus]